MNHRELFTKADQLTKNLEDILLNASFIKDEPSKMAANLCLTIFELHLGVITLLDSYSQSHSPLLVRSMLETLVNLKCLSNDRQFLNQIHHDDARQNVKIFEEFLKVLDDNDPAREEIEQRLRNEKNILEGHTKNKIGKMSISEKFKLAGLGHNYASYSVMCSFTHNNATTVYARHGVGNELDFAKELPVETFKMILGISISTFICVLNLLPTFSNVDSVSLEKALATLSKEIGVFAI